MENWRKFIIKEDIGYFGKKFVQFKEMVDAGHHPLKVAKLYLTYVGKGSTRMVFGFKDNDTHLLKVINVELIDNEEAFDEDYVNPFTGFTRKHKTVSNENEADLMMQQRYPNVFPRTYEYAEDYSWILVEKVDPITSQELAAQLGIPEDLPTPENKNAYMVLLDLVIEKARGGFQMNEIEDTAVMSPRRVPAPPPEQPQEQTFGDTGYTLSGLEDMATEIVKDRHLKKLFKAVSELGIPPREIQPKNLGISKFGGDHLVILDASLWEYDHDGGSISKQMGAARDQAPPSQDTFRL